MGHRFKSRTELRDKASFQQPQFQLKIQPSSGTTRLLTRYTVWVKNERLGEKLVVVCDAPDVSAAIQQALEQAACNWECGTDILFVYGVAEGDVNSGLQ